MSLVKYRDCYFVEKSDEPQYFGSTTLMKPNRRFRIVELLIMDLE
jgi:hypothetical protein